MASESRVFPCNTCSITFTTNALQRSHMRQAWHVNNIRRRVAKLPAIPEEQYNELAKSQETIPQSKNSYEQEQKSSSSSDVELGSNSISEDALEKGSEISEKISPTQCLFCNLDSPSLSANVDHMSSHHGLFIPLPDQLSDMKSFIGYLAILVFEYNECIYCNLAKGTIDGIQTHMRDRGHCMINMNAESALLDFWELSDTDDEVQDGNEDHTKSAAIKLSETEMRLPSGVVIHSRSDTTQLRTRPGLAQSRTRSSQHRAKRAEMKALTAAENQNTPDEAQAKPSHSDDRRVAVRGEMGLIGVSESQRRALQITEKKMKRREAVAQAAYRYAMERQPKKAIYYQTENPVYQAG